MKRSGYFRSRRTAKRGTPQNQLVERDRERAWRWGGCSVDISHGLNFTRGFMDSREFRQNEKSLMNKHNNKAGRLVSKRLIRDVEATIFESLPLPPLALLLPPLDDVVFG